MSRFTTALDVEFIDGKNWLVTAPLVYEVGQLGSGRFICVPAGATTDFASVPRGLWNLFPPVGLYGKAAVLHDYLYQRGIHLCAGVADATFPTKQETDAILREAMNISGVGLATRWTVWAGVRIGGRSAWAHGHKETK
jgi:hypothetical protein